MRKIGLTITFTLMLFLFSNAGIVRAGIEPATPSATPTATLNYPAPSILPGSLFYFIKRLWENVQLVVANNPTDKVTLLSNISKERLSEANTLIDQGRSSEIQGILYEYTSNKKDQVKIINEEGSKISPLVISTALANNLEELSTLNVLKQNSPFKIDETTINKIQDTVEVSTEVAVNQIDHPIQGAPTSMVGMPGMSQMTTNPSPTSTPAVSSNTDIPPQINSVPSISSDQLSQPSEASASATPSPSQDNISTSSSSPSPADQTTPVDQTPAAVDQSTSSPVSNDTLYSATDSAQPAVQGASTKHGLSFWDQLVNFFTNIFK